MFRLIGFQCVITKASAERAFHRTSSLSPLDREEMREELGDAEGPDLEPRRTPSFPRTPNKDEQKVGETGRMNHFALSLIDLLLPLYRLKKAQPSYRMSMSGAASLLVLLEPTTRGHCGLYSSRIRPF